MFLPKKIWIICRVCLEQRETLHDIFEKISSFNIWLSLRDCGGVPVRKNDNLPDKICKQCLEKLTESYKFRLECQRGHREITHKLSDRNYNIYKQELEEERKASSDFSQTLKYEPEAKGNSSPLLDKNQQTKLRTPNNTEFPDKEDMTIKMDTEKSLKPEEIKTVEIADDPIKHYCIVKKKHLVNDEGKEKIESFENDEQKRILLLLKMKNEANTKNKLNTESKRKSVAKPKNQSGVIPKTKEKNISKTIKRKLCKTQKNFTCKLCKKTYNTYELLHHHNFTHHKPHQCKICGSFFSQSQALQSHLNSHSGEKPFNCRICDTNFSDISNRNRHERTVHIEDRKKYKCHICDKHFRFLWMLKRHSNRHKSTKCLICGKVLATIKILIDHQQRKHLNKEKPNESVTSS